MPRLGQRWKCFSDPSYWFIVELIMSSEDKLVGKPLVHSSGNFVLVNYTETVKLIKKCPNKWFLCKNQNASGVDNAPPTG